ncbi:MAG: repair protein RadA [Pseudonocardiales bacterium]|nr:repair protein RadA [Pseudonocardiales bacterium]
MAEVGAAVASKTKPGPVRAQARPITEHGAETASSTPTGVGELDRVLGGGLVAGSVVLLAGEPGVGKSTLLLEVARSFAADTGQRALIVTGEESTAQVRLRAERTNSLDENLFLAAENDLAAILTHIDEVGPGLLVLDSIQTVTADSTDSGAGSVAQIRAVASALIGVAKTRGIATVLVGHVTKDGSIAGPRVLEHLVDVVLHFEGDRHSSLRLVRAVKNRYGATDEVGCFEMREDGIIGLADPSGLFLSRRNNAVAGTCVTVTIEGRRPILTEVQSLVNHSGYGGSPRRSVTDLDASRVAMVLAILTKHSKLPINDHDVYAASVGGLRVTEPAADLAIALAVQSAAVDRPIASAVCAMGELSLSGDVRPVGELPRRLAEAARLGFRTALVPADPGNIGVSGRRAAAAMPTVSGLRVVPVANIGEAIEAAAKAALAATGGR